jgi:hypothetical protein
MPADEFVRGLIAKGGVEMSETRETYQHHITALREARAKADKAMAESVATPTQEENDLLRLGLMHPDEKGNVASPARQPQGAASEPAPHSRGAASEPAHRPASAR